MAQENIRQIKLNRVSFSWISLALIFVGAWRTGALSAAPIELIDAEETTFRADNIPAPINLDGTLNLSPDRQTSPSLANDTNISLIDGEKAAPSLWDAAIAGKKIKSAPADSKKGPSLSSDGSEFSAITTNRTKDQKRPSQADLLKALVKDLSLNDADFDKKLRQFYSGQDKLSAEAFDDLPHLLQSQNHDIKDRALQVLQNAPQLSPTALTKVVEVLANTPRAEIGFIGCIAIILDRQENLPSTALNTLVKIMWHSNDIVKGFLYEVITNKPSLPDEVLFALAQHLNSESAAVLGNQAQLSQGVLQLLQEHLDSGIEKRIRAAHLLLTINSANDKAREILEQETVRMYLAPLRLHHSNLSSLAKHLADIIFIRNIWDLVPEVTMEQVRGGLLGSIPLLLKPGPNGIHIQGLFDLLDRAQKYTQSPRRLMKFLSAATLGRDDFYQNPDFWNNLIKDPENERLRDMQHKERMLEKLRTLIPSLIESYNDRIKSMPGKLDSITGIMVIGSFSQHPTPQSDLDFYFVTQGGDKGRTHKPTEFVEQLKDQLNNSGLLEPSKRVDYLGQMRKDSLQFKRHLAIGSIYIDANPAAP